MTLNDDIIKSALLGVARSQNSQTLSDSTTDASEAPEAQLLLQIASTSLNQRAGFRVPHNPMPLPDKQAYADEIFCSDHTLHYLNAMLFGLHHRAMIELLIALAQSKQVIHESVLPNLLLLGQKKEPLRPYLILPLGQRGVWLAQKITNQNWNWALEWAWMLDAPEFLDDVIRNDREDEGKLISRLYEWASNTGNFHQNNAVALQLKKLPLVWSDELATAFVHSLSQLKEPRWGGSWWQSQIVSIISSYAYHFPLSFNRPDMFTGMKNISEVNQGHLKQNILTVMDFREKMLLTVQEGGT